MIQLAKNLRLPADLATQTTLIVGKRGSGKTSTGVRLVEQLGAAKVPFVVLDPADAWWGLKSSKDGRRPGLDVYVFGGRHRDAPLEPTAGKLIAEVLVEHRISMVLAIKEFSNRERARFVTDFAQELVRRNTEPLHVVLEEAHEVAPQSDFRGAEEMLGAVKRLWKLGRSSGIGGSAITQRPAALHKDITTQAEILIVHRTIGPQDVAAVREWIKFHGDRDDILAQLGELKTGEAFVWAPDFPEDKPLGLIRTRILPRDTFDSSATPKAGQRRREPRALRKVDLDRLRSKMAATIEREQANDPTALRKKVAELERRLREAEARKPAAPAPKRVEVPVLKDSQVKRLEALAARIVKAGEAGEATFGGFADLGRAIRDSLLDRRRAEALIADAGRKPPPVTAAAHAPRRPVPPVRARPAGGNGGVTPARQRILNALAFLEGIGIGEADKTQVALLAGASPRSGAYFNNLGGLRTAGLLEYPSAGRLALTQEGRGAASFDGVPSSTAELHQALRRQLPPAKWRLVEILISVYPRALAKADLAERAGASATSGAYFNNLGSLRSLGLIDYPASGQAIARPVLFLEGREGA